MFFVKPCLVLFSFSSSISHFFLFTFSQLFLIIIGRGDRMKQAKADAQELIDSYRAEKQQEFNNQVLTAGKYKNKSQ